LCGDNKKLSFRAGGAELAQHLLLVPFEVVSDVGPARFFGRGVGENEADLCFLPTNRFQQVCGDGRRSSGYTQGGKGREAGGAGGTAAEEISP
jgi:hypothetical protein